MATNAFELLKSLVNKLGSSVQPSTHSFLQLDVVNIKREMELPALAQERGQRDMPAADLTVPDEIEHQVIARIDSAARDAHEQLLNQLNTYNERLELSRPAVEAAEISFAAREAIAAFRANIAAVGNELYPLREAAVENTLELVTFRRRHHLTRLAHYPKTPLWNFAVILVLFLGESVPNAMFLGENDQLGLLGGWITAFVFSFVSLGLAFLTGFLGWRACCHSNPWVKVVGIATTAVLTVIIVVISLGLAHFRVASMNLPPDAAATAGFKSLFADPFGLTDIKSWGMVGVGLLLAFIVMVDGYVFDDRYPGYGALSRRRSEALEMYSSAAREAIADLAEERAEYSGLLRAAASRIRDQLQTIAIVLDRRHRLVDLYRAHIDHLEQVCQELLSEYREANRKARKARPPARFDQVWHFERRPETPHLHDEIWTAAIGSVDVNNVAEEFRGAAEILHQEFEATVAKIGSLDQLLREEGSANASQERASAAA